MCILCSAPGDFISDVMRAQFVRQHQDARQHVAHTAVSQNIGLGMAHLWADCACVSCSGRLHSQLWCPGALLGLTLPHQALPHAHRLRL